MKPVVRSAVKSKNDDVSTMITITTSDVLIRTSRARSSDGEVAGVFVTRALRRCVDFDGDSRSDDSLASTPVADHRKLIGIETYRVVQYIS